MDPSEPPPKRKKRKRTAKERKAKKKKNHDREKRSRGKSRYVKMDKDTYKQWCSAAWARGLTPSEFAPVLLQTALVKLIQPTCPTCPSTTTATNNVNAVTSMNISSPSEDHGFEKVETGRMEKHMSAWVQLQIPARVAEKSKEACSESNPQREIDGKNKAEGKHGQKGDENEIDQNSPPHGEIDQSLPPHRQLRSRSKEAKCNGNRMHLQEESGAATTDFAPTSLQSGLEEKNKGRGKCTGKLDQKGDENEMEHSSTRHTCIHPRRSRRKRKSKRNVTGDSYVLDKRLLSTWSCEVKPTHVPEFEGPAPGPTTMMTAKHREIDFFHLLFPPCLISSLVMQTNKFADSALRSADSNWTTLSLFEMQAFLGLRVLMSTLNFPDLSRYWSSDGLLQRIITQKRFQQISQYFNVACSVNSTNTGGGEGHVNPYNVHMVFENVNHNFRVRYNPHRNCVMAEAGSWESKDNKIWMRVDPFNGYCSEFQMCDSIRNADLDRMVFSLTLALQKQNYIVNIGNRFTNGDLLMALQERGILGRGVISPMVIQSCSLPNHASHDVLQQGSLTTYQWQDEDRNIQVISSADNPHDTCHVRKTFGGHCNTVPCPDAVLYYRDHMRSIQSSLQLNKTIIGSRSSLNSWAHLFWFAMDVAVANALVLMKESTAHSEVSKELSSSQFRKNLAKQLIWGQIDNGESLDHECIKEEDHLQCENSGCATCWL